jgi:hypothetical protein
VLKGGEQKKKKREEEDKEEKCKTDGLPNSLNECQCETRLIRNITLPMVSQQIYIKRQNIIYN